MTLKEKVLLNRDRFRKNKIFEINNPNLHHKYFGVFEHYNGELHYDSSDSYDELLKLKNERKTDGISKQYKIIFQDDFLKLWFDVEFWQYMLLIAKTEIENQHYNRKLELLKEQIF